jgi:filamentous hemagglutinin
MHKKSLFFVSISVLLALLLITGCSNPTGSSGASTPETDVPTDNNSDKGSGSDNSGDTGGTLSGPNVSAADLAAEFAKFSTVTLGSNVATVDGLVPAGKTLVIIGAGTAVTPNQSLEVNGSGSIEIRKIGQLNASQTGTAGYLKGTGSITGDGTIALPYVSGGALPDGGIDYKNTSVVKTAKAVGSIISSGTTGTAIASTDIAGLYTALGDKLTLGTVSGAITPAAIPAGKELTLSGANTITTAFDLSGGGTLTVNGTLTTTGGIEIKAKAVAPSNIIINGTLDLTNDAGASVAGLVTNNGTIKSKAATAAIQTTLLTGVDGSGTVVLADQTSPAAITSGVLTQNVEIGTGGKLTPPLAAKPFTGGKTITITDTGVLDLGIVADPDFALNTSDVKIVNNGTTTGGITTATLSAAALNKILAVKGPIFSTGAVTGDDNILVPLGTNLTHSTGAFLGSATATLTINGEAEFTTGTFEDQEGAVTVGPNGKATFTLATFAALETGLTIGPNANVIFTAATFTALTQELTINGTVTLGGVAVPKGNVNVAGRLNIGAVGAGKSLTIETGKALNITGTGADNGVFLTSTGAVILKTTNVVDDTHAKITGLGKLSVNGTEIIGGSGGWSSKPSTTTAETITIASTAVAGVNTITGSAATGSSILVGGTDASITQPAIVNNNLTLSKVKIDLSENGSLVLIGSATTDTGAKITLGVSTAPGIIKGAGETTGTTGPTTSFGGVVVANLTVTGLTFTGDTGVAFNDIKATSAAAPLIVVADDVTLTIDKTTTIVY